MPSQIQKPSRREFLLRGAQVAAGTVAAGQLVSCIGSKPTPQVHLPLPHRVLGANDRINLACIGIRSRGAELMRNFAKIPNVRIKSIVDIDETLYAPTIKKLDGIQPTPPDTMYDLRRALDDQDIDAVTIATPNHWHALATIWACQAGKHVYVEKPVSHNIWEGRQMVAAARKYGCLVSAGFHNRSIENVRRAMQFLHDGQLGQLYLARGLCFKPRDSIGHTPDSEVPAGVHYDLWLGCAPQRPFNKNRFHYNWHWFWDYGNGDIGNQGPHQFDLARWGLNKHEHPVKVQSAGGHFQWDDDQQTPNTQTAAFEYADGTLLTFEVRGLYTSAEDGITIGNLFYGTEGWMHLDVDTNWATYFGRKNEPGPSSKTEAARSSTSETAPSSKTEAARSSKRETGPGGQNAPGLSSQPVQEGTDPMNLAGAGGGNHFENFIKALRSGKRADLTCDIEEGHMSTVLPHLANIAYRCGRTLSFDGRKEQFQGDAQANALLTRNYRKPFVVPQLA